MGYEKLKVTNGKTKWTAELLSHVEDGIVANEKAIEDKQPKGDYALKSEIPSTEGLATEEYVDRAIENIPTPEAGVNEEYVNTQINNIPNLDLLARFSLRDNCLYFDETVIAVLSGDQPEVITGGFSVLFIGNSYSENTAAFMHTMARSLGVKDIEIAVMQEGGAELKHHNLNKTYKYIKYGGPADDQLNTMTVVEESKTLLSAITERAWTWIVLQQASKESGHGSTYGSLDNLIASIKNVTKDINPDLKFAWNMTWAWKDGYGGYSQAGYDDYVNEATMYNCIVEAVQENVVPNENISAIIPAGTAIQNIRGLIGEKINMNGDGSHLNAYGCFTAGLTAIITLLLGDKIAVLDDYLPNTYAPFVYDSENGRIIPQDQTVIVNWDSKGVQKFNTKELTNYVIAAMRAIKNPFVPDVSFIMEYVGKYDSTCLSLADQRQYLSPNWPEEKYISEITGREIKAKNTKWDKYCRTIIFTPDTLPVGSVIETGNSWHFRPHKWPAYNRCADVSFDRIKGPATYTIDDEFWMGYEYAAFDIDVGESTPMVNPDSTDPKEDRITRLKPNAKESGKTLFMITRTIK